jgi:aldehyde dehydrogenase (NAD+)
VRNKLIDKMKRHIDELYGDVIRDSSHYPSIVNDRHYSRLTAMLTDGTIAHGGRIDPERRLIEPTLITGIRWDAPIMQEEIFGPLLPILEYTELDDIIRQISERDKPLALYLFTESSEVQQRILDRVSFGGGCINDTIMHLSSPYLPFGGVGPSGTGAYHGKYSFDAFSHEKGILKQTTLFDIPLRYGRTEYAVKLLRRLFR